jgi:hypothetical protein
MKKQLLRALVASACILQADMAFATCNSNQVAGTYALTAIYVDAANDAAPFRCPALVISHNAANKYNISAACALDRLNAAAAGFTMSSTGGLVVNPTNCRGSGTMTIKLNTGMPEASTVVQWHFQNLGTAKASFANGVLRKGSNTALIVFTMTR